MEDYEEIDEVLDIIVKKIFDQGRNISVLMELPTWEFNTIKTGLHNFLKKYDLSLKELRDFSDTSLSITRKDMNNIRNLNIFTNIDFQLFFKTYLDHLEKLVESKHDKTKKSHIDTTETKPVITDKVEFKIRAKEPEVYAVFISHAIEDKTLANSIKQLLSDFDIKSFVAHDDIKKGEPWQSSIIYNLYDSKVLLVLGTKYIETSTWVNFEVGLGYDKMFPLLFDELSDQVSYIKGSQGIDVRGKKVENVALDLLCTIASKLGVYLEVDEKSIESLASFRNLKALISTNYFQHEK
jgi:hypothetical protein